MIPPEHMPPRREQEFRAGLTAALDAGGKVLGRGGTSLDAVGAAVEVLEDSPLFNAGRGAVLNSAGEVELDAAVMDGANLKAGAVAGVRHVKNPIRLARRVMDFSEYVLLSGAGAEAFARDQGWEMVPQEYFITEHRKAQLARIQCEQAAGRSHRSPWKHERATDRFGTVGAVALDRRGNLAAATSTGGIANKEPGRVGDTPLIGAGTYADNATCAVSATGEGEFFIRAVAAHEIAALMAHKGLTLRAAASRLVRGKLTKLGGEGGVIAVDRAGNIAMPFNSRGMYRGCLREGARPFVAISRNRA